MTTVTSVPIVVEALHESLKERGFDVQYSGGIDYPRSTIILGDTVEGEQEWASMRSSWHPSEETYLQEVTFNVLGHDGEEARKDAFAGMAALGDMLSEDPSLGLSPEHPTLRMRIEQFRCSIIVEPNQGHRAILTTLVRVAVRLSRN